MSTARVVILTDRDLRWLMDDEKGPIYRIGVGTYPQSIRVDPFPCYPHDSELVTAELAHVERLFPLPEAFRPTVWVMERERWDRTNAWTQYDEDYSERKESGDQSPYPFRPSIGMQGKRIPPHPAMTRYLISHEYGHVVERVMAYQRGLHLNQDDFIRAYCDARGLDFGAPMSGRAPGRAWHMSPHEIFACDFRILVACRELEYWPHQGVPRPEDIPSIMEWWSQATVAR